MLTLESLLNYKRQNPKKYAQKFGNQSFDEILGNVPQIPTQPSPVIITSKDEPKSVELEFAPTDAGITEPTPTVEPIKPKRGRKPKDNGTIAS